MKYKFKAFGAPTLSIFISGVIMTILGNLYIFLAKTHFRNCLNSLNIEHGCPDFINGMLFMFKKEATAFIPLLLILQLVLIIRGIYLGSKMTRSSTQSFDNLQIELLGKAIKKNAHIAWISAALLSLAVFIWISTQVFT